MISTDDLFADESEWGRFHDVLIEIDNVSRSSDELRTIFERLPVDVRDIAHAWGLSDTVFGDEAYRVLQMEPNLVAPNTKTV